MELSSIKIFCVGSGCGKFIEGDPIERFILEGNYCRSCCYKTKHPEKEPNKYEGIVENFLHKET